MSCFLKQFEHFVYGPAYGWITLCWGFRYLPGSLSKKVFGFSCSLGKVGSTVFKIYSFFFLCISVWLYECMYVYYVSMLVALGGQKRALYSLGLELLKTVSYYVGARNHIHASFLRVER